MAAGLDNLDVLREVAVGGDGLLETRCELADQCFHHSSTKHPGSYKNCGRNCMKDHHSTVLPRHMSTGFVGYIPFWWPLRRIRSFRLAPTIRHDFLFIIVSHL